MEKIFQKELYSKLINFLLIFKNDLQKMKFISKIFNICIINIVKNKRLESLV